MARLCEILLIALFIVFFILPLLKDVIKVIFVKLKGEVKDIEHFIEDEVLEEKKGDTHES